MINVAKLIPVDSEQAVISPEIYKKHGKNLIVEFDKCFNTDKTDLNLFIINKSAYSKNLDLYCRYSNCFFKQYDHDKEFVTGLLVLKYNTDNVNINYPLAQFISDIHEFCLTDSIIKKIFKMVDDYYAIDLSPTDDVKDIDLHALQFMNEHGKAMLALSIAYKLTIPIVCHYFTINSDKINEMQKARGNAPMTIKEYLYLIFTSYFPLFQGESELFNKFAMTVDTHLKTTQSSDKAMWSRNRNNKMTPNISMDKLIAAIVVDLLPKCIFAKNLIFLIQSAVPFQIKNYLQGKDSYEFCDISTVAKTDELSSLEKMEANSARISDLDVILSRLNTDKTIKIIEKDFNITVTKDEMDFYRENLKDFAFSEIVLQFFAKYFGGYADLRSISKKNYIHLLIIFKKVMSKMGFIYLHQILTGNISPNIKKRKISSKQLAKIEKSPKFQKIMKQYSMAMEEEKNSIMINIASLINTAVTCVDYDQPDRLGEDIKEDYDIIADEYMRFIKML